MGKIQMLKAVRVGLSLLASGLAVGGKVLGCVCVHAGPLPFTSSEQLQISDLSAQMEDTPAPQCWRSWRTHWNVSLTQHPG